MTEYSDIQIRRELCVLLDEYPARFDLVAHQSLEEKIGLNRVLHLDFENSPRLRIHRRLPELIRIHLAKTFVALNADRPAPRAVPIAKSCRDLVALLIVERVVLLLPLS